MQCNQPACCAGYPNCGHVYAAYNCAAGPQWLPNPCMPTFPFCAPPRPCPEVIGEGEVTTVVLPDGTTQLYFLPLTKWCKPQIFNPQCQQSCGNNFLNSTCGIWFIRSFTNAQSPPFPYCNSNTMCFPTSHGPVCSSLPYPALCDRRFHNDGWTSTTDLRYFCPGIRCTVCTVFPSKCSSVQTSLICCDRREVANKCCEKKPSYCNATCSYDSVFLNPPPSNCNATYSQPSCMSVEECEQKKEQQCCRKKRPSARDSDCSTISACMSLEKVCSECDCGNKTKRKNCHKKSEPCCCAASTYQKKSERCCCSGTRNCQKRSETCCCSGTPKRQKKSEPCSAGKKVVICDDDDITDCGDNDLCPLCNDDDLCPLCKDDDLCSLCKKADSLLKKNMCHESFDYCDGTRGGDCTVRKDTNTILSSCSNSIVDRTLDIKTEKWIPCTDRSKKDMAWGDDYARASCSRAR